MERNFGKKDYFLIASLKKVKKRKNDGKHILARHLLYSIYKEANVFANLGKL